MCYNMVFECINCHAFIRLGKYAIVLGGISRAYRYLLCPRVLEYDGVEAREGLQWLQDAQDCERKYGMTIIHTFESSPPIGCECIGAIPNDDDSYYDEVRLLFAKELRKMLEEDVFKKGPISLLAFKPFTLGLPDKDLQTQIEREDTFKAVLDKEGAKKWSTLLYGAMLVAGLTDITIPAKQKFFAQIIVELVLRAEWDVWSVCDADWAQFEAYKAAGNEARVVELPVHEGQKSSQELEEEKAEPEEGKPKKGKPKKLTMKYKKVIPEEDTEKLKRYRKGINLAEVLDAVNRACSMASTALGYPQAP